jgi:hypothetical protein
MKFGRQMTIKTENNVSLYECDKNSLFALNTHVSSIFYISEVIGIFLPNGHCRLARFLSTLQYTVLKLEAISQ